jgi:hypothetical protein
MLLRVVSGDEDVQLESFAVGRPADTIAVPLVAGGVQVAVGQGRIVLVTGARIDPGRGRVDPAVTAGSYWCPSSTVWTMALLSVARLIALRSFASDSGALRVLQWMWTDSMRVPFSTLMPAWFDSWSYSSGGTVRLTESMWPVWSAAKAAEGSFHDREIDDVDLGPALEVCGVGLELVPLVGDDFRHPVGPGADGQRVGGLDRVLGRDVLPDVLGNDRQVSPGQDHERRRRLLEGQAHGERIQHLGRGEHRRFPHVVRVAAVRDLLHVVEGELHVLGRERLPVCQVTPGRSLTVHTFWSGEGSARSASQGSGFSLTCDQKSVS